MTKKILTQQQKVVQRLQQGWTTALDALKDCGCMRLAARVLDYRRDGIEIQDRCIESNGKRFKAYRALKAKTATRANG